MGSTADAARAPIAVAAVSPREAGTATDLAGRLNFPLLQPGVDAATVVDHQVILLVGDTGLSLQQAGKGAPGPVSVDFSSPTMRHRRHGGQNELLGRAAGVGKKAQLQLLDGTAGLGRDSFVLADLGCMVTLCERNPLVAELLGSGLQRGRSSDDAWVRAVCARMTLHAGDVRELPASRLSTIDVIYLDPMFPGRSKSAGVKKEMALFQFMLESNETGGDSDEVLLWALQQNIARVVVKRPLKAPPIAGRAPSHIIAGKSIRYDVYVLSSLSD